MRSHILVLACVLALFNPGSAFASWAPTTVVQGTGVQYLPSAASDGADGSIVAWWDDRGGAGAIYVHHVLSSDAVDPAWPVNGTFVGAANGSAALVPDGAGGAIVVRTSGATLYADHVLANGTLDPAWPMGGRIVTTTYFTGGTHAVSDGAGGALLAWVDVRGADRDIYAHRVLANGTLDPAWTAGGVGVCTAIEDQDDPAVVGDGAGGFLIAWSDFRNSSDNEIFAQRILGTGAPSGGWPVDGRQLTSVDGDQITPRICSDGAAGAIVAWSDNRDPTPDIYAMRVRSTGALATGWRNDGEVVCDVDGVQEPFEIVPDGAGGAVVSWQDGRPGDGTNDIYVQRVTASGAMAWTTDGAPVCTAANHQLSPSIAPDGSGGVMVAWQDLRDAVIYETDLYVHHVLSTGAQDATWPANGGRVTFDGRVRFGGNFAQPVLAHGGGNWTTFWAGDANTGFEDVHSLRFTTTWTQLLTLQVTLDPSSAGSVSRNPDRLSYPPGTVVNLTPIPGNGHTFTAWSGDLTGSVIPGVVTMNANKSVTASFDGYAILTSVAPGGTGTVTKNPNQARYLPGTEVTLKAVPAGGYQFASWSGDASGSTNPLAVTVMGPTSITANFTIAPPTCGSWSATSSAQSPSVRIAARMVWDPVRHRALLFGGHDGVYRNDVWQFTLAAGWSQIVPAGTAPSPRAFGGLIYDPVRDRLLVIHGNDDATTFTDVVALSLAGTPTWSPVPTSGTGPSGLKVFSTVYDPVRDRVLAFGGTGPSGNSNALWSLALPGTPTWTQLAPGGAIPSARAAHLAFYDPVRDRMVVHGGASWHTFGISPTGGTSALALSEPLTWTSLGTGPAVYYAAGAYDSTRDRFVLVGGNGFFGSGAEDGATQTLSLEFTPFWLRIPVGGFPMGSRTNHVMVHDPDTDAMLLFGGAGPEAQSGMRRLDCGGGMWLQAAGGPSGTVNAYPSKLCYSPGETVTLQAVGNGYALDYWSGDASGDQPLIEVTMDAHKAIWAQFYTSPVGVEETPARLDLAARPNPSNGPLEVSFTLPRESNIRLAAYDIHGRLVARLAEGRFPAGPSTIPWDPRENGAGKAGVYFIRFDTPEGLLVRRVVLLD